MTVTAEKSQAILASDRELFAGRRRNELAKASQVLQRGRDSLGSVRELDELLEKVTIATSHRLGAVSTVLRLRDFDRNCLTIDFVYDDNGVMAAGAAEYPQSLLSIPLDEQQLGLLNGQTVVFQLVDRTQRGSACQSHTDYSDSSMGRTKSCSQSKGQRFRRFRGSLGKQ